MKLFEKMRDMRRSVLLQANCGGITASNIHTILTWEASNKCRSPKFIFYHLADRRVECTKSLVCLLFFSIVCSFLHLKLLKC